MRGSMPVGAYRVPAGPGGRRPRRPSGRGGRRAVSYEALEPRRVLATILWDGGPTGDGTSFGDPLNWAGDVLPGPADTAVIDATGSSPTISLTGAAGAGRIETSRRIALDGASIAAAVIATTGGGALVATEGGAQLDAVTLAGDLDVSAGRVRVTGGLSLDGGIVRIGGRGPAAIGTVIFDGGTQAIGGTGRIIFGESASNRMHVLGTAASQTLTIEPGIVIRGNGGTIEGKASAPIQLVNKGTIVADAAPPFPSDPGYDQPGSLTVASQGLVNEGTLGASGGGTLRVSTASVAAWANAGTIAVDRGTVNAGNLAATTGTVTVSRGTLDLTGDYVQTAGATTLIDGILDPSGGATISGGTLAGDGTVKANLTSAATIEVGRGGAAGTLAVEGAFTQSATGTLRVEIGRPASDLLRVTGAALLGGTLDVGVIDAGSLPLGRTVYDVLRHASVSGAFAAVSGLVDVDGRGLSMETAPDRLSIVSEARDAVPPTLVIAASRTDIRTGETAAVAFTLSEDATDFTAADVAVTGGTLSAFAGSGRNYTALFTPTAGFTGPGGISVAAGAFADAAGNANLASASPALAIDTLAPTIRITASPATLKSGATAKITFTLSKASTTFALDDVVAGGGTLSAFVGTGTTYSATFTPRAGFVGPGTVTVGADAFTDSTGRGNAAGSLATPIAIDTVAPTVAIATDKPRLRAGETAQLTFTLSEESVTFTAADVTVAGGTLSAFSGTGAIYTATFTPTAGSIRSGTVSVAAGRFTDKAGNLSTAGALAPALSIDTLLPKATITASPTSLLFGKTSKITFTLSEASSDFTVDDVAVTGGALSGFTPVSPTSYWATFTPAASSTADGTVGVAAGGFTDAAGNGNVASGLAAAIRINTIQPTIAIASDRAALKGGEKATITFTLSEPAADFGVTDVRATGGVLSLFSGSGSDYSAIFTPAANFTGSGTVTVAAGAFRNAATNPNVAAALAPPLVVDTLPPTLKLTSDKAALKAGETATITFTASEPIVLDLANVTVGGGTLADLTGAGALYKATFTPTPSSTASGTVTVAAGRFADLAGNRNTAGATLAAIKVDTLLPSVKVACAPATLKAGVVAKVTFSLSESSASFDAADVVVTGGTLSSFTAVSGSSYWASFTPAVDFEGAGTVAVAAGSFRDAAGNGNLAGALASPLRIDTLAPTVVVTADRETLTSLEATAIRFTLSEPSSTFTASKVVVVNGTLSDFTGSGTSYAATFKPKLDFTGTATVSVPAGRFLDAVGNPNPASPVLPLAVTAAQIGFRVTADRPSAVYACGEPARITVTLEENGVPKNGTEVVVRLTRDNLVDEGEMRLTVVDGRAEFVRTLDEPGFLTVTADIGVFARASVAFSPERIGPAADEPIDFDAFWEAGRRQLAAIPHDPVVTPVPSASRAADAYKISLANVDGTRVWGFLSVPKAPAGPMPLLVSVPGASFRAPAAPGYEWVDQGVMRLWISVHPHDPQLPKAELDALEQSPAGQYHRLGAPDPGSYYFRRAILGADRLVDWVCDNYAWDGAHCVAQGHSQGGAFALFLAGFNRRVTACAAEAPAMCDHAGYTIGRSPSWPQLASGQDPALQDATLAMSGYYEAAFFARRIVVPTLFTVGFHDIVCPPSSGYAAYNQIAGPKAMIHQLDRGHLLGHPYYETTRDYFWLPEKLGLRAAQATGGVAVATGDAAGAADSTGEPPVKVAADGVLAGGPADPPMTSASGSPPRSTAMPYAVAPEVSLSESGRTSRGVAPGAAGVLPGPLPSATARTSARPALGQLTRPLGGPRRGLLPYPSLGGLRPAAWEGGNDARGGRGPD